GQLDNAEIRAEMATGLRENFDQLIAHFLSELRQILFTKRSDVGWRTDSIEQTLRRVCCLGGLRIFRRVWFCHRCFPIRPLFSGEDPLLAPARILVLLLSQRYCE